MPVNALQVSGVTVQIVMLCGIQGLAFRGHRDDKIIWTDVGEEHPNEGNFVELVRFRAETDPTLAQHLANSPRNARYTSKTIQNVLVKVVGNTIRNDIVDEVECQVLLRNSRRRYRCFQ